MYQQKKNKIKNGHAGNYRQVRTTKPKVEEMVVPGCFNFDITNVENNEEKEFINHFLI